MSGLRPPSQEGLTRSGNGRLGRFERQSVSIGLHVMACRAAQVQRPKPSQLGPEGISKFRQTSISLEKGRLRESSIYASPGCLIAEWSDLDLREAGLI